MDFNCSDSKLAALAGTVVFYVFSAAVAGRAFLANIFSDGPLADIAPAGIGYAISPYDTGSLLSLLKVGAINPPSLPILLLAIWYFASV